MEYLKEWKEFNPGLDLKVKEYVSMNKYNLPDLWNKSLSEDENVDSMIEYFTKYPNEMVHSISNDNIRKASQKSNSLEYVPILQNIGGHSFEA
jgi:hypothetical protein